MKRVPTKKWVMFATNKTINASYFADDEDYLKALKHKVSKPFSLAKIIQWNQLQWVKCLIWMIYSI